MSPHSETRIDTMGRSCDFSGDMGTNINSCQIWLQWYANNPIQIHFGEPVKPVELLLGERLTEHYPMMSNDSEKVYTYISWCVL